MLSFLANFPSKFDYAKSHILSNFDISSLHDTFNKVLRIEISQPFPPTQGAFVNHNDTRRQGLNRGGNNGNKNNQNGGEVFPSRDSGVVCYYCVMN